VVKEDKTISMRPVTLGPVENDMVAIDGSIAPGELVVVDGIDRLREGAKVEVSAPFVPRQGRSDAGKRGGAAAGEKPKDAPANVKAGAPAATTSSTAAPAPKAVDAPPAASSTSAPAQAASVAPPAEPPKSGGGGWRDMSDEQKAELRKKMEGMTDEQKAEFRKKMRERAQQSTQ
jgi:membrane fusion protein, multidrug efflux system